MRAIDTNVLVHYHREEMPKHREAVALLKEFAEGQTPWGIPVFCVGEFLRVVTHRSVFSPPTPLEDALSVIKALLVSPAVQLLLPGAGYWPLLTEMTTQAHTTGNLVFDAQIAAVCIESGVDTLVSEDRGFARFEGIRAVPI